MKTEHLIQKTNKINNKHNNCSYDSCTEISIQSHVIPENWLYKINDDPRKIITFEPYISMPGRSSDRLLKKISIDKFSTFPGFCTSHDNDIFKLIDLYNGVINNEKAVLIHYRNLCYGLNHIKTQILRLNHLCRQKYIEQENNDNGKNVLNLLNSGDLHKKLNECMNEHLLRKQILETMIKACDFSCIQFQVIPLEINNPIFFGRSSFLMHQNEEFFRSPGYCYAPWISYITMRNNEDNHLVFCWLKNDEIYSKNLNHFLNEQLTLDGLIYASSDGFAVDESFYNQNKTTIDKILEFRVY